jgi:endonuclease
LVKDAVVFALEAHLRDFLAKNPNLIESGLKIFRSEEYDGVEYPVDNGRIDLLAIDREDRFVVVELKLSQGRNKALGQLLYYMGWVDQHLGNGPCRGLIIGSEITDELAVAASRVPGVRLAKYRMNFSIEPMT